MPGKSPPGSSSPAGDGGDGRDKHHIRFLLNSPPGGGAPPTSSPLPVPRQPLPPSQPDGERVAARQPPFPPLPTEPMPSTALYAEHVARRSRPTASAPPLPTRGPTYPITAAVAAGEPAVGRGHVGFSGDDGGARGRGSHSSGGPLQPVFPSMMDRALGIAPPLPPLSLPAQANVGLAVPPLQVPGGPPRPPTWGPADREGLRAEPGRPAQTVGPAGPPPWAPAVTTSRSEGDRSRPTLSRQWRPPLGGPVSGGTSTGPSHSMVGGTWPTGSGSGLSHRGPLCNADLSSLPLPSLPRALFSSPSRSTTVEASVAAGPSRQTGSIPSGSGRPPPPPPPTYGEVSSSGGTRAAGSSSGVATRSGSGGSVRRLAPLTGGGSTRSGGGGSGGGGSGAVSGSQTSRTVSEYGGGGGRGSETPRTSGSLGSGADGRARSGSKRARPDGQDRPFACDVCGFAFKTRGDMKVCAAIG